VQLDRTDRIDDCTVTSLEHTGEGRACNPVSGIAQLDHLEQHSNAGAAIARERKNVPNAPPTYPGV
jgi:hypothetical protein